MARALFGGLLSHGQRVSAKEREDQGDRQQRLDLLELLQQCAPQCKDRRMTHSEFNHLLTSIKALSPEQVRQLRQQIDSQLAQPKKPTAPVFRQGSQTHQGCQSSEQAALPSRSFTGR